MLKGLQGISAGVHLDFTKTMFANDPWIARLLMFDAKEFQVMIKVDTFLGSSNLTY